MYTRMHTRTTHTHTHTHTRMYTLDIHGRLGIPAISVYWIVSYTTIKRNTTSFSDNVPAAAVWSVWK